MMFTRFSASCRFPTAPGFYDYLVNHIVVQFRSIDNPKEPGMEIELSKKTLYTQLLTKLCNEIHAEPSKIRLTGYNK